MAKYTMSKLPYKVDDLAVFEPRVELVLAVDAAQSRLRGFAVRSVLLGHLDPLVSARSDPALVAVPTLFGVRPVRA